VTRCDEMTTLDGGEASTKRGKGGDDASWAGTNLTGQKMKKIHALDSTTINE
jgi:hypothetical protein